MRLHFRIAVVLFTASIWVGCGSSEPESLERQTILVDGVALEMVYIPAGEFLMGSENGWVDERPVHRVRISSGFWLARTETTQGLWRAVMARNPSHFQNGDSHPVECVSWRDCQAFISKLNKLTGLTFRLPREAEWEYACYGGSKEDRPKNLDSLAWYDHNSNGSTHPVAGKRANAFGLHDMLGNVWEWCADFYDSTYYARAPVDDPRGAVFGRHRVDRGGGWAYGEDIVRAARRDGSGPDYKTNLIGFRLVADRLR